MVDHHKRIIAALRSRTPPRLLRFASLFTRAKLPAWIVILWEIFQNLPDWHARVDFWIDIAKKTGGFWGGVAQVISVPYFNLGLTIAAVLWLGFAGEPKKFVRRHPWLPYLGWAVFGIILAAIGSTIISGYFQFRVKEEVSKQDIELQKKYAARPVYWHLTDAEKLSLAFELDKIPVNERFEVKIKCLPDAGSRTFVEEMGKIFLDKKWNITANCLFSDVRPDLVGLWVSVPKTFAGKTIDDFPKQPQTLINIFKTANITGSIALDDIKEGEFFVIIGNAP